MSSLDTSPTLAPEIDPITTAPGNKQPQPRRFRRFDLRRDAKLLFLIFGGVLAVNLIFWLFLVRPKQSEIRELSLRKQSADLTEMETSKRLDSLRKLHDKVTSNQAAIRTFYGEMLSTKRARLVPFQRAVAEVGREFDCEPDRVAMSVSEMENEGIEALGQTFPITGGYENLRGFLARLESISQFLIVREVTLAGSKEGGQDVQLNVAVETYFDAPGIREEKEKERAEKAKKRRQGGGSRRVNSAKRGATRP
ncbi:MAG: hypothetical protein U0V87_02060 [Acidobacteriota bacterium]